MKKYHILINDLQKGPFTFEELKEIELNRSTLIWFKEMTEWTELYKIEELNSLVENSPPPVPKKIEKVEIVKKETANQIINAFKLLKISLGLGIFYFIGYSLYSGLIGIAFFDTKFSVSDAENILGYTPSQYVFKETSKNGEYGLSYGIMEISDSGYKAVKNSVIGELTQETLIFTFALIVLTFILLLSFFYLKKGVIWIKKYSS